MLLKLLSLSIYLLLLATICLYYGRNADDPFFSRVGGVLLWCACVTAGLLTSFILFP